MGHKHSVPSTPTSNSPATNILGMEDTFVTANEPVLKHYCELQPVSTQISLVLPNVLFLFLDPSHGVALHLVVMST